MSFTINSKDISTYGGKMLDKMIGSNLVNSQCVWDSGIDMPYPLESSLDYKRVYISVLFEGMTDDQFFRTQGRLTDLFRAGAVVVFSDIQLTYTCWLEDSFDVERLGNGAFRLNMNVINDFGKSVLKSSTFTNSRYFTIDNQGLYATPARITITVPNLVQPPNILEVKGMHVDWGIERTTRNGAVVVVDTEKGTVTIDGVNGMKQYIGYEFPKLKAGENNFELSQACNVTIEYKERY